MLLRIPVAHRAQSKLVAFTLYRCCDSAVTLLDTRVAVEANATALIGQASADGTNLDTTET